MFTKLKNLHQHWMQLDPPHQFMAWTVLGVMFSGLLLVVFALLAPAIDGEHVPYVIVGVGVSVIGIVGVFVSAILYLTVFWPHYYYYAKRQDSLLGKSKRAQEKTDSKFASTNTKVYMKIEDSEESLELIENAKLKRPD